MIEVNLLPGPKKKKASGGAGLSVSFDELKALVAKVKDPLLVFAVGGWAAGLAVIAVLYTADARRLAVLQEDLTRIEAEQRRFGALIAQKRKSEQLRDSLVTELNVIRGIDAERYVWPHIMEEVTRALPDYTWLVSVDPLGGGQAAPEATPADTSGPRVPTVRVQIDGRTSDIQAYTRFLRQLANSPWITNVVAGATNTAIEQDRPVTAFTLQASFRRADSAYIRTAAVNETLR
jgi:Tfp pilus assembly protein PilN